MSNLLSHTNVWINLDFSVEFDLALGSHAISRVNKAAAPASSNLGAIGNPIKVSPKIGFWQSQSSSCENIWEWDLVRSAGISAGAIIQLFCMGTARFTLIPKTTMQ